MQGVDLFCGCGGLSLGFQQAGIGIAAAYDNWAPALQCYRDNFSHPAHHADLGDVAAVAAQIRAHQPDIIIGGPPCQDFSSAGKREEKDRASLTLCYAGIIAAVRPKWFVMENVERAKSSRTYREARAVFKKAGYGLTEEVLNACHYGVPQSRKRFFCIGLLGAADGFLSQDLLMDKSAEPVSIADYFRRQGVEIEIKNYYRHPRSYVRRAVFSIDEPSPTIRGVNRPVPKGYGGHNGDKVDVKKVRALTTRERAHIQSFPADFKLPDGKTVAEQLLGNAVPVGLAYAVANAIFAYNAMLRPDARGRKPLRQKIGEVEKETYMRLLLREGHKPAYAKDSWSWLQRAEKYLDGAEECADSSEFIYRFTRAARRGGETRYLSRMQKSLEHLWTTRRRQDSAQSRALDFGGSDS